MKELFRLILEIDLLISDLAINVLLVVRVEQKRLKNPLTTAIIRQGTASIYF